MKQTIDLYENYDNKYRYTLKSGDIVWACNFKRNIVSGKFIYKQTPVKGMIVDLPMHHIVRDTGSDSIWFAHKYFVPFCKDVLSEDAECLDWNKAVSTESRVFSKTEKESIELYNHLISLGQKRMQQLIDEHKAMKLPIDN